MTLIRLESVTDATFAEVANPEPAGLQREILQWWAEYSRDRPTLFNGAMVACESHVLSADRTMQINWFRTCYAHYLIRRAPAFKLQPARSIYASVVLVSETGRIAVGEMAATTASPGRLQLPGGNIESDNTGLSLEVCRAAASRELAEEVGLDVAPQQLRLWRVKIGGEHDDIGLLFAVSNAVDEAKILDGFAQHTSKLIQAGQGPEFDKLLFLDRPPFGRISVDYLSAVCDAVQNERGDFK